VSRPGKRTTIVDIAQRAQVSISTVSRVLNGQTISDQLLAGRVRQAAAELGYRPNVVARDFRRGVTSTIGVVVPDLANPFFPHVLKGLAEDVSAGDHRLLVVDSGENPEQELRLVTQLAGTCDGIILCSPRMPVTDLEQIATLGVPVVCTNRSVGALPFGTVGIDSASGMRQAIAHLHDLGHRQIGYLGGPATSWSDSLRREGLRAAASEYGLEVVSVAAGSTSDDGFARLPELLTAGVTGVIAFSDIVAIGALARLRELSIEVPTELSVIGFDDIPVAAFLGPPLTTVTLPKEELGRRAWALLHAQMQSGDVAPEQLLPATLTTRSSTAPPAR
jgi:DNA-binding LacI/PurR family transcriptional regulator